MTPKSSGKIIVLTGVSRGLGRAMLQEFVDRGHFVIGCARNSAALNELKARFAEKVALANVDVTSDQQVAQWAASVLAAHEAPDLLINNAAIINKNAPLWSVSASEFSEVIDVNIKGVANVIRHFVPAMVQRNTGVIVNFSSGWGRSTDAQVAPYCATKWAVEGLTQALAQELPDGMAAVPLNPGVIDTDMLRSCFGDSAASYDDPGEWVRRAVPFLLSLNAEHNGQPLTVP